MSQPKMQPEQCQICTYDPNHCNGNQQKATIWECTSFHVNSVNIKKLIDKIPKPQPKPATPPPITQPQATTTSPPQATQITKFLKAIYNVMDLIIWRLRHRHVNLSDMQ